MCFRYGSPAACGLTCGAPFLTFNRGCVVSGLELSDVYQIGEKREHDTHLQTGIGPCLACAIMQNRAVAQSSCGFIAIWQIGHKHFGSAFACIHQGSIHGLRTWSSPRCSLNKSAWESHCNYTSIRSKEFRGRFALSSNCSFEILTDPQGSPSPILLTY